MPTLYELSQDLIALDAILADIGGEFTNDDAGAALEKWFDELGEQRDQKVDGYCALIREMEARAEVRQAEAVRLSALAATDTNNAKRLKNRLKEFFDVQGLKKIETSRFRVAVQANGGAVPLILPDAWEREPASAPEAFQRRVIQLDREAVRVAVQNGDEAHGASLGERGSHLRIK